MASALDAALLALADPIRRRIFEVLFAGATRAAEIATAVGMKRDDLSGHLAIMESAGLIARQQSEGGEIVTADPAPLEIVAKWINTNRELWTMRSQMQSVSHEPGPGDEGQ
ncbi:ArsR/SmtB family transcription factor [Sinorhizobium mexicanum]|uniref:Winged helix-turn-helix transcriptional regulator n=1 Tax=Sinorhizobium mexicanum TaxID=375549 RepID=A0A859QNY0_9HYPH|nr:helix-turn-helix domain-containing protein [Sinorhizobium mexicanum]MBP1882726.1 DNA-binding transcriptional ArsR family regulator [Sinorhizobium mexicanum]QLL61119.1 winged helix-turn-helix transcriptional regulator [Sinorhizobium mexicanum]